MYIVGIHLWVVVNGAVGLSIILRGDGNCVGGLFWHWHCVDDSKLVVAWWKIDWSFYSINMYCVVVAYALLFVQITHPLLRCPSCTVFVISKYCAMVLLEFYISRWLDLYFLADRWRVICCFFRLVGFKDGW